MALTTVLTRNAAMAQATTVALGEEHALLRVATWTRLAWTLRERAVTCALIDGQALPSRDPEGALVEMGRLHPSIVLVLMAGEELSTRLLFRLGRAGVEGLVTLPVDGVVRELPTTVRRALARSTASAVMKVISPSLPRRETEALRLCMEGAQRGWGAEDVADRLGLTRPHLSVGLERHGLPSLGHLLVWSRLLHAARWLGEPGRSAESVSRQLGYSSGSAFRRALRNYVDMTPTEVVEAGGFGVVLERFVDECDLLIRPRAFSSVA
jgi:AraC-like DNA-binding protein